MSSGDDASHHMSSNCTLIPGAILAVVSMRKYYGYLWRGRGYAAASGLKHLRDIAWLQGNDTHVHDDTALKHALTQAQRHA